LDALGRAPQRPGLRPHGRAPQRPGLRPHGGAPQRPGRRQRRDGTPPRIRVGRRERQPLPLALRRVQVQRPRAPARGTAVGAVANWGVPVPRRVPEAAG
jgi:hypothetical protein